MLVGVQLQNTKVINIEKVMSFDLIRLFLDSSSTYEDYFLEEFSYVLTA